MVLLAAFTASFIFTTPTSALDPSITLTQDTNNVYMTVSPTSDIVVAGQTLTVTTVGDVIGYDVTIVDENANNSSMAGGWYKTIYSVTGSNQKLEPGHYGYTVRKVSELVDNNGDANDLAKGAIWNEMPTHLKITGDLGLGPVTIANKNSASAPEGDTIDISYGVNLADVPPTDGEYDYETKVTYTATATPIPNDPGGDLCRSGNWHNNCQVDIDANMIPVRYAGNETTPQWTVANPDGIWFDYSEKQWANAVTITKDALDSNKYKDANGVYKEGTVIDEADVLGYWVYIPRYAYQVMRRDATDKVVTDTEASAMGGFNIRFQKSPSISTDTKDRIVEPKKCDNSNANQYYQDCVGKWNAWATHPAFRWCTSINYETGERSGCTELNGIWVGKFETTGEITVPTVKPGVASLRNQTIGKMFDAAKKVGVEDINATGGENSGSTQNSHNLSTAKSHMLKNSEWGATTYLSASKFGAGVNNVRINANNSYTTGCGPTDYDSTDDNSPCNTYSTGLGQTASTTGNTTGIYDMAGGAWEYVMGALSTSTTQVANNSSYYGTGMKLPYVDLYPTNVFANNDAYTNNNQCTWTTCGGHALHETKVAQSVSGDNQSWGGNYSGFVDLGYPWFRRGGNYNDGSYAGVFASSRNDGNAYSNGSFRMSLSTQ